MVFRGKSNGDLDFVLEFDFQGYLDVNYIFFIQIPKEHKILRSISSFLII